METRLEAKESELANAEKKAFFWMAHFESCELIARDVLLTDGGDKEVNMLFCVFHCLSVFSYIDCIGKSEKRCFVSLSPVFSQIVLCFFIIFTWCRQPETSFAAVLVEGGAYPLSGISVTRTTRSFLKAGRYPDNNDQGRRGVQAQ